MRGMPRSRARTAGKCLEVCGRRRKGIFLPYRAREPLWIPVFTVPSWTIWRILDAAMGLLIP